MTVRDPRICDHVQLSGVVVDTNPDGSLTVEVYQGENDYPPGGELEWGLVGVWPDAVTAITQPSSGTTALAAEGLHKLSHAGFGKVVTVRIGGPIFWLDCQIKWLANAACAYAKGWFA